MIEVVEPATGRVMAEVPRAGVEETDAAVAAAKAAFPAWRAVAPGDRGVRLVDTGARYLRHHPLGCGLDDLDHAATFRAACVNPAMTGLSASSSACHRIPSAH